MANRANTGGWLQGKTVRKGGIASTNQHTARSNTPQIQSTSSTIFGGGVKDASGRTSEFFVSMFWYLDPDNELTRRVDSPWMMYVLCANLIGT
jgi:hypothetical protein